MVQQTSSIYGQQKQYLPQIMELLVGDIEKINASYKARYGEHLYEHFLYRIKSEKSMCEK